MNNLLVQYKNIKFINNIGLSSTDFCNKIVTETKNNLYKLYYTYNFSHVIFIASIMEQEEYQFIDDFGKNINIFVYNDNNIQLRKNLNIKKILQKDKNQSEYDTISIPKLVNNELFFSSPDQTIKNNHIISFLDSIDSLPNWLHNFLYPTSKLPIKLFNNNTIIHPQNLGLVSENDKALLLRQSKYYLAINDDYVPEAWASQCLVLSKDDLETLQPTTYKNSKSFQSYSNFLKVLFRE
ncbi:MAG: hypothetical protein EBQ89_02240 [Alphaproteobacteria bacterium]|nr:hypothetical protein [Alphaproteobacteria bacterium]